MAASSFSSSTSEPSTTISSPTNDGRSHGEVQLEIFLGLVISYGLGNNIRLEFILWAQPGHYGLEVLSGLAVGLIVKESDFKHGCLL